MCGRFSLTKNPGTIHGLDFHQSNLPLEPRFNIAPGQYILVIRSDTSENPEPAQLWWGLIPGWAKDRSISYKLANARSETVAEKPSFRSAFKSRRCLILADAFYEWTTVNRSKQPYLYRQKDHEIFTLAGLWEIWQDKASGDEVESCTILTTDANSLVAPVHHRMPVLIPSEKRDRWLDCQDPSRDLLQPYEWETFESLPVSTYVNNARNEGPSCHEPIKTDDLFS